MHMCPSMPYLFLPILASRPRAVSICFACLYLSLYFILSCPSLLPSAAAVQPIESVILRPIETINPSSESLSPLPQARIYSLQFGKFDLPRKAQRKYMCIAHTYVDVLCTCNTIPWLSLAAKSRKANIDSSNLDASPYGTVACKMYTRACCIRSFSSAICPASRLEKGGWARAIVPLCRGHVNHNPESSLASSFSPTRASARNGYGSGVRVVK
ncbi:hypothetical protein V8C43DRAFT_120724 [Trichoderma afarasin]